MAGAPERSYPVNRTLKRSARRKRFRRRSHKYEIPGGSVLGEDAPGHAATVRHDTRISSTTITTLNQPLGPGTVTAGFAGDGFYLPATAGASTVLFEYPRCWRRA